MTKSCKGLDVFDFKEEDCLPDLVAAKYAAKFKDPPNALDKYIFLQNVAQGTSIPSKAVDNNIACVNADESNSDHSGENGVSLDCDVKQTSTLDALTKINSTNSQQIHHFTETEVKLRNMFCGEGSSSPAVASPSNRKLNFTILETQSNVLILQDGLTYMVPNADESMSERSPSTSSYTEEDDAFLGGVSPDNCFAGWEMGNGDMTVVFCPDYLVYCDKYYTDAMITFRSSRIEVKGSTAYENQETFVFLWEIGDIINIESQFYQRMEMAMVKISVNSKDAIQDEGVYGPSGIKELKFAVVDPDWYTKQKLLTSFGVYKPLWNIMPESDMERSGDAAFIGENGVSFSKLYFPVFAEPFKEVIYPKGDADAVSISKRDVDLLQPDTFVNDTIIDFYMKYLKNKVQLSERNRFHFFNSFFFRKLADLDKDPNSLFDAKAAFQRVRKWTRKVNLFEKEFIFVPVNFNYHWSLLVICHPGEAASFQDQDAKSSVKVPCILHMDSIRGSHSGLKSLLQSYLWEEWKERHEETSEDITLKFLNLRFVSLELPQQQNSFDCGLFLLHYAELFLESVPLNFNPFKISKFSKFLTADWFEPVEASLKRVLIQRLIYDLLDNSSPKNSPDICPKKHENPNFINPDHDNGIAIEFLSDHCIPSKSSCDGNVVMNCQADDEIGLSLLPTSSVNNAHCAGTGSILRELFEPESTVGSLPDNSAYQAFNQTANFNEFRIDTPALKEEEDHFVHSRSLETGFHQLSGIAEEPFSFPHASQDFQVDPSWNPASINPQDEMSSSPQASGPHNENSQSERDLNLENKTEQGGPALVENVMLDPDHIDNEDPLSSMSNKLPGLCFRLSDIQRNEIPSDDDGEEEANDDCEVESVSEPDVGPPLKKLRLTPDGDPQIVSVLHL